VSLYGFSRGLIVSATPKLLAAGSNDILAIAATADDVEIAEVLVANADGSPRTILLTKFDTSNAWVLLPTKSVPANDTLQLTFPFVLPKGWTLRATPSANNVLTVHVTYIKTTERA
jgi:hypothetical protein